MFNGKRRTDGVATRAGSGRQKLNSKKVAKFSSIFKIEGTLEGMTFYKSKDGMMVRGKGGVSKERLASDPAFERTRENGREFGHTAKMAQLLRRSMADKVDLAKDHRTSSRLAQVLSKVKNLDAVSTRGDRTVANGFMDPEAAVLLTGFEFNNNSSVQQLFKPTQALDPVAGSLVYPDFIPGKHLLYPSSATEAAVQLIAVRVDFEGGVFSTAESPKISLPVAGEASELRLEVAALPEGEGVLMYLVLAEFFQSLNGVLYPLKNRQFNALGIIGVVA